MYAREIIIFSYIAIKYGTTCQLPFFVVLFYFFFFLFCFVFSFTSSRKHAYIILTPEAVITSTHNLCFEKKYEKYQSFSSENFQFLEVKFSIYLNRRVFVMGFTCCATYDMQWLYPHPHMKYDN